MLKSVGPWIIMLSTLVSASGCSVDRSKDKAELKPNEWLLKADSDGERFQMIQRQMRGFDQPVFDLTAPTGAAQ